MHSFGDSHGKVFMHSILKTLKNTSGAGTGAGAGAGASHMHNGIPQVHSTAGIGGGAGAASTSLRSTEERFSLLIDVLVFSTASPIFLEELVTDFALALNNRE